METDAENYATPESIDWEATARLAMADRKALRDENATLGNRLRVVSDGARLNSRKLGESAAELHALRVERDALRAQLDGMTTEWALLYGPKKVVIGPYPEKPWHGPEYTVSQRLVGPWVEVTD